MNSPTQRSLLLLKKEGYIPAVTEHFNPFAHIRQDLYGFIDIIGIKPKGRMGVLAVQTTSKANWNARIMKIMGMEVAHQWLQAGNAIEVHGWYKKGKKGEFQTWEVIRKEITLQLWEELHESL